MLTVFSSPTCAWCTKLKDYLSSKNVPFTEVDITKSRENRERLHAISGQSAVPVTVFERGEVVIGFDRKALDDLLQ